MHIHKIVYIKTFKIAPTCFDHLQGATLFLAKVTFLKTLTVSSCIPHVTHTVRRTLSGVPFTQYDMLPQHQINVRN